MQVQQIPIYYSMNAQGLIQAGSTVGQPPNIMIPTGNVSAGGAAGSATSPVYYAGIYSGKAQETSFTVLSRGHAFVDPRLYYSAAAAAAVNPHWQMPRSPPQQQQQQQQSSSGDPTRNYSSGQNVASQGQSSSAGSANTSTNTSRSASATGATNPVTTVPPPLPTQYSINGAIPAAYAYGAAAAGAWLPGHQIPSPQANLPGQINAAYTMMFEPSQQGAAAAQAAYVHPSAYDTAGYYSPQAQPQNSTQQNLDTVAAAPPGNYSR